MNVDLIVGSSPDALDVVLHTAASLHTAAVLNAKADYAESAGYTSAAVIHRNGANALADGLAGSPSIARLRAAVILLSGVTDETILGVTGRARDDLVRALTAVDDGTI